MPLDSVDRIYAKVKSLNELIWEGRADRAAVDQWLNNFTGSVTDIHIERKHALYLLSKFLFFGLTEVQQLLRSMFQDLIRQELSAEIRSGLADMSDFGSVRREYKEAIRRMRFVGLGEPAESGPHLLYHFRHVNKLPVKAFLSVHQLLTGPFSDPDSKWALADVNRVVFIDDFCGTGDQAADVGGKLLPQIRRSTRNIGVDVEVWYLTLMATTSALAKLRAQGLFDRVHSVSELDRTYRVFDDESHFYINAPNDLQKPLAEAIARYYGDIISPGQALGYKNSQLMLGFHHNVPDNTLPIISRQRLDVPWHPIFPRNEKVV